MIDIGHVNTGSVYIDEADSAIIVPTREEVEIRDPDEYLKRLSEMQSPEDRLSELLVSIFDPTNVPTHESLYIRTMAFMGCASGWIYGGILKNSDLAAEYARKFNHATYEGRTLARKHYTDHYLYTVAGRGIKHAIGGGLLCGSAGLVAFGSMTYRNKLYYPDWAVGFTTLGALSRFWSLGHRGAIGGGCFGLIGGTIGYGLAKMYEKVLGKSVSEMRYFRHKEYLEFNQSRLKRLSKMSNDYHEEKFRKLK